MDERRIDEIIVRHHIRQDLGAIEELAESIRKYGLLHPIVIGPDNVLIAGLRRLRACELLGWQAIPVRVMTLDDLDGEKQEAV